MFISEEADDNEYDSAPTNFTKDAPLKVLSPGWMSNGNSENVIDMKNAFLSTSDVNVVIVDWKYLSHDLTYFGSAQLTRYVGQQVKAYFYNIDKIKQKHC